MTFVAGAPAAASSSLALQPSVPVAGATTTVVVVLRDAFGNSVVGQSVALALGAGGDAALSPAGSVTDANGVATATLSTLRRQTTTLSATAGPTQLMVGLGVKAAAPDANNSMLALAPNVAVADGTGGIDVLAPLEDAYGNPVFGAQVQFAASGAGMTLLPPVVATDAAGVAEARLVGVVAGPT